MSIPGSRFCTDIDLTCDYKKIILIGVITSLLSQDITIYDDVNELHFIICLEKPKESNSSGKGRQFFCTGDSPGPGGDRKPRYRSPEIETPPREALQ